MMQKNRQIKLQAPEYLKGVQDSSGVSLYLQLKPSIAHICGKGGGGFHLSRPYKKQEKILIFNKHPFNFLYNEKGDVHKMPLYPDPQWLLQRGTVV